MKVSVWPPFIANKETVEGEHAKHKMRFFRTYVRLGSLSLGDKYRLVPLT